MKEWNDQVFCVRCSKEFRLSDKMISVFLMAQTTGISPRQKSRSQRISFCPNCAVSLAHGPEPAGAMNVATYLILRHLVGRDPALGQIAWERLNKTADLLVEFNASRTPFLDSGQPAPLPEPSALRSGHPAAL